MGGTSKMGGQKGGAPSEFGDSKKGDGKKGDSKKGGDKGDFAYSGKGDKKGGDKKGGKKGKGGDAVKLPVKDAPDMATGTECKSYISPFLFTEKAPSLRSREAQQGPRPTDDAGWDALRAQRAEETAQDKSKLTKAMDGVRKLNAGSMGEETTYLSNVIPLFFEPGAMFFQYSTQGVTGSKQPGDGKFLNRKLEKSAMKLCFFKSEQAQADPGLLIIPASSGIIFTNKRLSGEQDGRVTLSTTYNPDDGRKCREAFQQDLKLVIKFQREISTKHITQEVVTVISAVLRMCFEESNWQKIGRTYFDMSKKVEIARMNKSLVPGLYSALHCAACGSGLVLVVDVVHKCVGANDAWAEGQARCGDSKPDLRMPQHQRALKMLYEDTVMMSTYDNAQAKKRTVHIDEVRFEENEDTPQEDLPDKQSLRQYFSAHYNIDIPAGQPVLVSKNRKRRNPKTGEPMIEKYLPCVLTITGCPTRDPKSKPLREQMLKQCAVKPQERYRKIKEMLMNFIAKGTPWEKYSELLQLNVQKGFSKVDGRSMPKPTLLMADGWSKKTTEGSWNFDIIKKASNPHPPTKFFELRHPPKKGITTFVPRDAFPNWKGSSERDSPMANFERAIKHLSGGPVQVKTVEISSMDSAKGAEIAERMAASDSDGYVVVADDAAADNAGGYRVVKIESIINQAKPSQVVREKTVKEARKVYAVSIKCATQLLTKLGGSAWAIDGMTVPDTMVCGISFSHAGSAAGRRTKSSVAGLACSMNDRLTRYCMVECELPPGHTIATTLASQFRKCLVKYKQNNGKAPKYFIFYREGGSEGEVPQIMLEEVNQIKEAISEATDGQGVMAYFLVIRQSHLRLAALKDGPDKGTYYLSNPEFGAMVDSKVTHMCGYEFFLVSQKVDQGSATAVKYKQLVNDLPEEWDGNKFQQVSFNLCSLYYNWNGPIAVPAPCLYASRHARMFAEQLVDTGGMMCATKQDGGIWKNDCIACL